MARVLYSVDVISLRRAYNRQHQSETFMYDCVVFAVLYNGPLAVECHHLSPPVKVL